MGFHLAQHPAAAVKKHHCGQRRWHIPRAHNLQRVTLKIDFLHVYPIAGNVYGLHIAHQGPGLCNGEFVQRRAIASAKSAQKAARLRIHPSGKFLVILFVVH
jgi:hypothetical protein